MSKLNILVAYPYVTPQIVDFFSKRKDEINLIIDSGAFSAWNSNKTISMTGYCNLLDTLKSKKISFNAVQLDVFGDPHKSWENFLYMKKNGYDVMPVFTRGESLERLEEMYGYTDYIMFGGIVIGGKNKNYVKWFMERNKGRKVHWLGFTNVDWIKYYRPTSADSSSWLAGARFGVIPFASPKGGGKLTTIGKDIFLSNQKKNQQITNFFNYIYSTPYKHFDIEKILRNPLSWVGDGRPIDLKKTQEAQKSFAYCLAATLWLKNAMQVEEKTGTRVYLAVAGAGALDIIYQGFKFLRGETYDN